MKEGIGWKPIESAPRDGTKILLRKDGEVFVGWYDDKHDEKYAWWFVDDTELQEKVEQPFGYSETFVRMNAWGKLHGPEEWMGLEELVELAAKQSAIISLARNALDYHQSQTRPIQQTIEALAAIDALNLAAAPTPPVPEDRKDAERYNKLVVYLIGDRTDLDDALVAAASKDEMSAILDAMQEDTP